MRRRVKLSKELRAAIELQNKANQIAKVESRKPRWMLRAEAAIVRREIKRDSMLTAAHAARAEALRQAQLVIQRAVIAAQKRAARILKGVPGTEQKTEMGIVVPSGREVRKLLRRAER